MPSSCGQCGANCERGGLRVSIIAAPRTATFCLLSGSVMLFVLVGGPEHVTSRVCVLIVSREHARRIVLSATLTGNFVRQVITLPGNCTPAAVLPT